MTDTTRVFVARRILTMNPSQPTATHVAVRDGRILGFGTAEDVTAFGPAVVDDRFANKILMPGFVEGHGHATAGLMWRDPYVGFFPRTAPDGTSHEGLRSIAEVVAFLKTRDAALPPDAALI